MEKLLIFSALFYLITYSGCKIESVPDTILEEELQDTIWPELKENFSDSEFKEAIIGKWQSIFEHEGQENVIYLELSNQNKAKITIEKESKQNKYEGDYKVSYLRPPDEGMVTLAEITILTSNDTLVLSRVNFGLHNYFPAERGPFLRIDQSPYGVMERIK
ncbi:MAG: hypothetical protein ACERKD_16970 [Prolixibacteraceae bacterium]